jgi:hypothetical protein
VGEDGAHDRALWVLELRGRVDEGAAAKAGFNELRGDVGADRPENVTGIFGGLLCGRGPGREVVVDALEIGEDQVLLAGEVPVKVCAFAGVWRGRVSAVFHRSAEAMTAIGAVPGPSSAREPARDGAC